MKNKASSNLSKIILATFLALMVFFANQLAKTKASNPIDPENTIYIYTMYGQIIVEFLPKIDPNFHKMVKELSNQSLYGKAVVQKSIITMLINTKSKIHIVENKNAFNQIQKHLDSGYHNILKHPELITRIGTVDDLNNKAILDHSESFLAPCRAFFKDRTLTNPLKNY